jgi:hypothetical protein
MIEIKELVLIDYTNAGLRNSRLKSIFDINFADLELRYKTIRLWTEFISITSSGPQNSLKRK